MRKKHLLELGTNCRKVHPVRITISYHIESGKYKDICSQGASLSVSGKVAMRV